MAIRKQMYTVKLHRINGDSKKYKVHAYLYSRLRGSSEEIDKIMESTPIVILEGCTHYMADRISKKLRTLGCSVSMWDESLHQQ